MQDAFLTFVIAIPYGLASGEAELYRSTAQDYAVRLIGARKDVEIAKGRGGRAGRELEACLTGALRIDVQLSNAQPARDEEVTATARVIEGVVPQDAVWDWRFEGGVAKKDVRAETATFIVGSQGRVTVRLFDWWNPATGQFGKVLKEASVEIAPDAKTPDDPKKPGEKPPADAKKPVDATKPGEKPSGDATKPGEKPPADKPAADKPTSAPPPAASAPSVAATGTASPPGAPPVPAPGSASPASGSAAGGYWVLTDVKDTRTACGQSAYYTSSNCTVSISGTTVTTSAVVANPDGPGLSPSPPRSLASSGSWTEFPKTLAMEARVSTTLTADGGDRISKQFPTLGLVGASTRIEGLGSSVDKTRPSLQVASGETGTHQWYFQDQVVKVESRTMTVGHLGPGGGITRTYTYTWTPGAMPATPPAVVTAPIVSAPAVKVTVALAGGSPRIPIGQTLSFQAQVSSSGGTAPPAGLVYRWQPNPEVTFTPFEGSKNATTGRFPKLGTVKVWVDVLQRSGTVLATVAESNQLEIEVVKPELNLVMTPAEPYPGQDVRVTASETPTVGDAFITYWWEYAGSALNPGAGANPRVYSFRPKDTTPVTVTAHAKARDGGDDLGTKIIVVTARPHTVQVTGPTARGPKPQIWDPKTGLVDVDQQIAVFQDVSLRADVTPAPVNQPLHYQWTLSPDGCSMSNPLSQEPTFNCSKTGGYTASVTVRDHLGATLGTGTGSVSISISQATLQTSKAQADAAAAQAKAAQQAAAQADAAKLAAEKQAAAEAAARQREEQVRRDTAQRLRGDGQALQQQGKLREAIAKYRESLTYVAGSRDGAVHRAGGSGGGDAGKRRAAGGTEAAAGGGAGQACRRAAGGG